MPLDKHHPDVSSFLRDIEERIERKRDGLERVQKTDIETAFMRGEIKAFRAVLQIIDTGDSDSDELTS